MKKLIFVLVCALIMVGCNIKMWYYHGAKNPTINHPIDIPVWVDDNFNQGSKEAIKKSMTEWNFVLNGQIRFIDYGYCNGKEGCIDFYRQALKTNQGLVILNLDSEDELVDGLPAGVLAAVPGTMAHSMVVIKDHVGNRELKDIALHEFGHILGAEHTVFPSLMYPAYDQKQYPCVDRITAMQVAEAMELDLETIRYCRTPTMP